MILTWLENVLEWMKVIAAFFFVRLKSTAWKVFICLSTFVFLLWIAIFLYGTFHWIYMPKGNFKKPVHFKFDVNCTVDFSRKLCSFPNAIVSFSQHGNSPILMYGLTYSIILDLDMPESPSNQNIGMFLTKIDLYSKGGKLVNSQRRSALMQYKSYLLQFIETLANIPLYLSGAREQKQELNIYLHEYFEDDPFNPIIGSFIEIQTYNIQIYTAQLRIMANYSGLRFFMVHYPVTCGVFGTSMFLSILISAFLLTCYQTSTLKSSNESASNLGQTLEERRQALKATLHKERTQSLPGLSTLQKDGKSHQPLLKMMSTSSNIKPNKSKLSSNEPETTYSCSTNEKLDPVSDIEEFVDAELVTEFDEIFDDDDMDIRLRKLHCNKIL